MASEPMGDPIFVIVGTCGEYSDRQEWLVCWYDIEAKARDHAVKAKQRAHELQDQRYDDPDNEFDPHCQWDYTETDYTVQEVFRGQM